MNTNENIPMLVAMFEEIKQSVKGIEKKVNNQTQQSTAVGKVDLPDLSGIEGKVNTMKEQMLSKLYQIEDTVKQPVIKRHRHRITFDIRSSWVFTTIVVLVVLTGILLFLNYKQWEALKTVAENDLKYRYIKASDGIDANRLLELENVFEYNRNERTIKELRQQVKNYEWAVKQQAQKLEQAKFKEAEAERLRKEAGELKTKSEK